MSIAAHIEAALQLPDMIVRKYLEDLSDADLLLRPAVLNGKLMGTTSGNGNLTVTETQPNLPPGVAKLIGMMGAGGFSIIAIIIGFFISLMIDLVFATIGALIGTAIFHKKAA